MFSTVNLTYQCLFQGINDLARQAGIKSFQVQFKKNAQGDIVFALIVAGNDVMLKTERPNDHGPDLA